MSIKKVHRCGSHQRFVASCSPSTTSSDAICTDASRLETWTTTPTRCLGDDADGCMSADVGDLSHGHRPQGCNQLQPAHGILIGAFHPLPPVTLQRRSHGDGSSSESEISSQSDSTNEVLYLAVIPLRTTARPLFGNPFPFATILCFFGSLL
jgi:hypothetical protein